ncbi:hypothetical protein SDC9_170355 [bioreactor metagenome]|uniref:Uncharacterized protein n=1 Tax=bioreactor metagenome TaxID=1076179 RepID=A0A645GAA7_9ZZZZ
MARVYIGDKRASVFRHPGGQAFKTSLLRLVEAGHESRAHPHAPPLKISLIHSVDADGRKCEDDDLSVVRGVRQSLRIAAGGRGKDDFSLHGCLDMPPSGPYRAVAQRQVNSVLHKIAHSFTFL